MLNKYDITRDIPTKYRKIYDGITDEVILGMKLEVFHILLMNKKTEPFDFKSDKRVSKFAEIMMENYGIIYDKEDKDGYHFYECHHKDGEKAAPKKKRWFGLFGS